MNTEFKNTHIAEVVASRLNGTQIKLDTKGFPAWIKECVEYFQSTVEVNKFNDLYLKFVIALPVNARQLKHVRKNDFLVCVLKHTLQSLNNVKYDRKQEPKTEKSIVKVKDIINELIEKLNSNATDKELKLLRDRANAANAANANAAAAAAAAAAANYDANTTYAAYAAANAAYDATYAANAATYATATATATAATATAAIYATANAAYATATATAYAATAAAATRSEALEYYFTCLIELTKGVTI